MKPVEVDGIIYRVKFFHERYDIPKDKGQDPEDLDPVFNYDGAYRVRATTYAELVNEAKGDVIGHAETECSWLDNFDRSTGRFIALERLLNPETSGVPRAHRRAIWNSYWAETLGWKAE